MKYTGVYFRLKFNFGRNLVLGLIKVIRLLRWIGTLRLIPLMRVVRGIRELQLIIGIQGMLVIQVLLGFLSHNAPKYKEVNRNLMRKSSVKSPTDSQLARTLLCLLLGKYYAVTANSCCVGKHSRFVPPAILCTL